MRHNGAYRACFLQSHVFVALSPVWVMTVAATPATMRRPISHKAFMECALSVLIPHAVRWLLRIASNEQVSGRLCDEAVAFAGWYAQIGELLEWPEEVTVIREAERRRKLSLDRTMKLLGQVNYVFHSGRTSVNHARLVLEGYAVHDWVRAHPEEFRALAKDRERTIIVVAELAMHAASSLAERLTELAKALRLSELEEQILMFAFLSTASEEFAGVFRQLTTDRWTADRLWAAVFATNKERLARVLRANSALRLCGLLHTSERAGQIARVSDFWVEFLADADELFGALLEPLAAESSSGMPARLLEDDQQLAIEILRNASEPGVNLLLYGAGSLDKRRVLRQIVSGATRTAWRVRQFEEAGRTDRPSLTYVAFQLLAQHPEHARSAVLVIERPTDVLDSSPSQLIRTLFGVELEAEDAPAFDEHLLTSNAIPGLWLASRAGSLAETTTARFVFHAPLKQADKATRVAMLRESLTGLRLSSSANAEILRLEGVSSAQIESAVKAARLAGKSKRPARDQAIVQAVRRSQRALCRDLQPKIKESVTRYSLKYLNTAGRFHAAQIVECFRKKSKGTLLLYGPPGTGKTQFVEYLAGELDMPLVSRSASDLLSKWVGESEKNIAQAFEYAANEDAILFFDEGDSFLRSREYARASWEVTQINEFLQHIERFSGTVVVATNLFKDLDHATIRRFIFKLEFRELDLAQRWEMFVNEAGVSADALAPALQEEWTMRLALMKLLTPGDFATVKRQCNALEVTLTPAEWLEQLNLECRLKCGEPYADRSLE